MGVHRIRCIAPGVGREAAERLEASLARVGRRVLARRSLPLDGKWPVSTSRGIMDWVVREPEDAQGTVLMVDEFPVDIMDREPWQVARFDLAFWRALSAEVDGFVMGTDSYSYVTQDGIATFFAGRTFEAVFCSIGTGSESLRIGARDVSEAAGGPVEVALYKRFDKLCESDRTEMFYSGEVLIAEEWEVSPPAVPFTLEPETLAGVPVCRAVLPHVPEEGVRIAREVLPANYRLRPWRFGPRARPILEAACAAPADIDAFKVLTARQNCTAVVVMLYGGEAGCEWAILDKGEVFERHNGVGASAIMDAFDWPASLVATGPGMLFGRGKGGWVDKSISR